MNTAPGQSDDRDRNIAAPVSSIRGKKMSLLYLGKISSQEGVDDLIRSWKNRTPKEQTIRVLARPTGG